MTEPGSLEAARARLQAGFSAGDLDVLSDVVTDDVVWRAAALPVWVGRSEVLARLGDFFDRFAYRFHLENTRLDTGGDRAVERSNFVSQVIDPEAPTESVHTGSVVIIWTREEAAWRVAAYFDVGQSLFT